MAYSSACLCLVTMLSFLTFSTASYFHVGGPDGWSSSKNINYTKWAESIHFQVGDVLVFEYDNKTENVLRVNPRNYNTCNLTVTSRKWTGGNDQVRLRHIGVYYFVSSLDGKCEERAMVSIKVYENGHDTPSPDTPTPVNPSPVVPEPESAPEPATSPAPAPNPSSAVSLKASMMSLVVCLLLFIRAF